MQEIKKLSLLAEHVKNSGKKTSIAVAVAEDSNTLDSVGKAVSEGWVHAILIGNQQRIKSLCDTEGLDHNAFEIIDIADETAATAKAVQLVKTNAADVLMKGLVGTDKFLKAVLQKEKGLLPPKAIMSYVCALELPRYPKLLFISDTAVLPNPDLDQKIAMVNYSVSMARRFGIDRPKVALITATEKVGASMPNTLEYAQICKMAERNQIRNCIIDGPLDIFLACDPAAGEIKGVQTPIAGDADVLIFPDLESANSFYKGMMLFSGAELAGLIQGTEKPVVVMSRSESSASKYYCIALACLMAGEQ